MKTFDLFANGTPMGEYRGESESATLDSYAQAAGYPDFSELLDSVPNSTRDEIDLFEIDTESLINAIPQAVYQDAYGDGIALVDGVSFATYRELAHFFGLKLEDFYR